MLSLKLINGKIITEPNLDWNTLPRIPIQWMQYEFQGKKFRFIGYLKYLRLKEMVYGINCNINSCSKIILAGQKNDKEADILIIDINKKTVEKSTVLIENVYSTKINVEFWKPGIATQEPNIYTVKQY